jgi:hypothetical protein
MPKRQSLVLGCRSFSITKGGDSRDFLGFHCFHSERTKKSSKKAGERVDRIEIGA